MTAGPTWITQFPGNFVWSNATLVTKGMAPYGAVALGEIDEVCRRRSPARTSPMPGVKSGVRWAAGWKRSSTGCRRGPGDDRRQRLSAGGDVLTCPFLVVHAEDDQVVPVASARRLHDALGSTRTQLKIVTAADGSTYHAQADNRQVGVDYIAD